MCSPAFCQCSHLGNNAVLLQLDWGQRMGLQEQLAHSQVVHVVVLRVQSEEAKELGQQSLPALRKLVVLLLLIIIILHVFLPRGKVRLQTSYSIGCKNPAPCWTRQILARPNQSWALCSSVHTNPFQPGQCANNTCQTVQIARL